MGLRKIDINEIRMKSIPEDMVPEEIRAKAEELARIHDARQAELKILRRRRAVWGMAFALFIAIIYDCTFFPKTLAWRMAFPLLSMILARQVVLWKINHLFATILAGTLGFGYPIVGDYLNYLMPIWGAIFFSANGYICFYLLLSIWASDRKDLEENPY